MPRITRLHGTRLDRHRAAKYLTVEGQDSPGEESFQRAISALYRMAFTIKMTSKSAGRDYSVCKIEAQYRAGECGAAFESTPKGEWRWKLMIRTPEFVDPRDLRAVVTALAERGKVGDLDWVRLETMREGRCVQMLHVGPYEKESESIEAMRAAASDAGCEFHGVHNEIYLSDPRRVAPEKPKTILRIPVRKKKGSARKRGKKKGSDPFSEKIGSDPIYT